MKTLMTLIALVSMQHALASGVTTLQSGDVALYQAPASIVSVRDICKKVPGQVHCQIYGSVVTVNMNVSGCVDHVGGYFSRFEHIDGKGVLYFGSVEIANKYSKTARCVMAPNKQVEIMVPFEGEIELVNLDFNTKKL
jgi:hypothetical protein